ncbi:putative transcription factor E2F-DP family [Lupinus albus]|uniref:Putative transcription factor E2F-DP family n=1 Tax=Lupinus albus TaxID=3870 RepID=A0A6A4PM52_LUPAL|nr:putative transcription factor E2F-DP family [Lupinus albus]
MSLLLIFNFGFVTFLDNRRGKSLALLTQNFVKLFICSNMELISLDDAANLLLEDAHSSSIMTRKVRRLYDIANVLSSMNLIEKTHTIDTKKPAFRWLGLKENQNSNLNNSRKRAFGTDISNIDFKRNKVNVFMSREFSQNPKKQKAPEHVSGLRKVDISNLKQCTKHSSSSYHFGSFAPTNVHKVGASSENNNMKQELFTHYMEAWKSWYSEIARKRQVQIL